MYIRIFDSAVGYFMQEIRVFFSMASTSRSEEFFNTISSIPINRSGLDVDNIFYDDDHDNDVLPK